MPPPIPSCHGVYQPLVYFPTNTDHFGILHVFTSLPLTVNPHERLRVVDTSNVLDMMSNGIFILILLRKFIPMAQEWFSLSPKCFPFRIIPICSSIISISYLFTFILLFPVNQIVNMLVLLVPFSDFSGPPLNMIPFSLCSDFMIGHFNLFLTYNLISFHLPLILSQKSSV